MKFYIPSHLRKLKLIDQVARVIEAYVPDNDVDSFDDYRWYFQNDPIKRFLGLEREVPTKESEETDEEYQERLTDYETEINYLTKLFYTVKGTKKVIEYAQKFIPSLSKTDDRATITYSIEELKIELKNVENINEEIYVQYLEDFFNSLLIFKVFNCNINQINYSLDDNLEASIGVGVLPYKVSPIIVLSKSTNNTEVLRKFIGKTVNVVIERTFHVGKNSMCLPFSIDMDKFDSALNSRSILNYSISLIQQTQKDNNNISLAVGNPLTEEEKIRSGEFYVLNITEPDDSYFDGKDLIFENVTIEKTVPAKISSCPEIEGTFSEIPTKKELFLSYEDSVSESGENVCGLYFEDDNYIITQS